ncbi:MAG TPA: VOC family protein [Candidatus Saccharimonadales bacterium]|nr:VOC family protein [Candidatus Saccharimonadales bacterium]
MKRRHFIQVAASSTVTASMGVSARAMPSTTAKPPVMELRVALTTEAFDRLASFYRIGLGLEPAKVWPEDQGRALVLDMGKATLEVFDEKQAQTIDQIEVGRRLSGQIRFALQVPDLDAAIKRLLIHGATMVHPPVVAPWGDKTVRFQDPDGLQITLYQSLSPA